MKRRATAKGDGGKAKRRGTKCRRPSYADLQKQLSEAAEQQAATSEVLKVISSSPTDIQPVFETIAANALRLCEANWSAVVRFDGTTIDLAALHNLSNATGAEAVRRVYPRPPNRGGATDRAIVARAVVYIPDVRDDPEYPYQEVAQAAGYRSHLSVPILRHGQPVGAITVAGASPRAFSDRQVALLQIFADQAVIAIENTRLLNDLRQRTDDLSESLEQQTATSEVLKVISSSPGELEPVFSAMLENATRICEAHFGNLMLFRRRRVPGARDVWGSPDMGRIAAARTRCRSRPASSIHPRNRTKQLQHIADMRGEEGYLAGERSLVQFVETAGARTNLIVPMLKENELIGAIAIYRQEVRPFTDKQIELVQNFAAQAVIAIENTRLLNELREILAAADRDHRGAQASSPVRRASCSRCSTRCWRTRPASAAPSFGALFRHTTNRLGLKSARFTTLPEALERHRRDRSPIKPRHRLRPCERGVRSRDVVHIADVRDDVDATTTAGGEIRPARERCSPCRCSRRTSWSACYRHLPPEVQPVHRQADRAGEELRRAGRDRHREHAAAQRTAPAHRRSHRVAGAADRDLGGAEGHLQLARRAGAGVRRHAGECHPHLRGQVRQPDAVRGRRVTGASPCYNAPAAYVEGMRRDPVQPLAASRHAWPPGQDQAGRPHRRHRPTEHPNEPRSPGSAARVPLVVVPMLKDDELIGAITIYRQEVRPFTDKQIELVQNFAAQAVIAIENTRLLNELRELLQQQTATADVLKVISRSTVRPADGARYAGRIGGAAMPKRTDRSIRIAAWRWPTTRQPTAIPA